MSTTALVATPIADPSASTASAPRRSFGLLVFLLVSLGVTMSITQEETPELGSLGYWLLVMPALLLPLTDVRGMTRAFMGRARPLVLFGLLAGAWQLGQGDVRAAQQLFLMVWVLGWLSSDAARVRTEDLTRIYAVLVIVGSVLWLQTDINKWGVLPGTTAWEYAQEGWRLSFFPNIANSAVLSLVLVLVLTRRADVAKRHALILLVASYFMFLSFVRTALIGIALYAFMMWWLHRRPRSARAMFWMALGLGIGVNLLVASSVFIFSFLQQFDLVARLFLRSSTDLSPEEIYAQLYRPWLWMQHLELFWTSPSMMGLGAFDFAEAQLEELNVGTTPAGNEAQLTRLLATYGLPAFLYAWFFVARLREATLCADRWAVACFPTFVLLLMQWGSVFHPSDANGALFTLIAIHGGRAFLTVAPALPLSPRQAA